MLRLRYQHRYTSRPESCLGLSKEQVTSWAPDVDKVDPPADRVQVQVVGVARRTVESLESQRFHKAHQLRLRIGIDDEVEIQGQTCQSMGSQSHTADQCPAVLPGIEKALEIF